MPNASDRRGPQRTIQLIGAVLALAGIAGTLAFPALAPNPFILSIGVTVICYAVYATAWNFVGGFIGYISLGHASYSGVAGYGVAILTARHGVNPWLSLLLASLGVAVLAIPIGVASLRVRGASFVIVSIALVVILQLVGQSWSSMTGGSSGMRVPRPFPASVLRPAQHERFYYLFAALLALTLLVWWLIDRSRFGISLKAIREDEDKAQSLGIPTFRYKLVVFVVSAFFMAAGGGLYALWFGSLDPIFQFSVLIGANTVLMALLGGVRSLVGPVLGAAIVGSGMEYFKTDLGDTQLHLVALGVLLGAVVLFMPDGIVPSITAALRRFDPEASSIREVTQRDLHGPEPEVHPTSVGRAAP